MKRSKQVIYCWWKKSCTTQHIWNPLNKGIFIISTGAGFLPSTISCKLKLFDPLCRKPQTSVCWQFLLIIDNNLPLRNLAISHILATSIPDLCSPIGASTYPIYVFAFRACTNHIKTQLCFRVWESQLSPHFHHDPDVSPDQSPIVIESIELEQAPRTLNCLNCLELSES